MGLDIRTLKEIEQKAVEKQVKDRAEIEAEKLREKRETCRFWINTGISAIAAISAVLTAIFTAISLCRR